MQRLMATNGSDITKIITYCQRDCDALFDLNKAASIIDHYISVQKELQLPLSYILNQTPANCLTLFLMREFTANGFAVSYYGS